jgi:hypothetical protein
MHRPAHWDTITLIGMQEQHRAVAAGLDVEAGFLQVDTDGRVIRVDSFSKILAPGLRLAWVTTTPNNIVHCLNASFMPTLGPSTMSQDLAWAMLRAWGFDGFEKYVKRIQVCSVVHAVHVAGWYHALWCIIYCLQSSAAQSCMNETCGRNPCR